MTDYAAADADADGGGTADAWADDASTAYASEGVAREMDAAVGYGYDRAHPSRGVDYSKLV